MDTLHNPMDHNGANIFRPPSPTSSIGSTHPQDQTPPSDDEANLPQALFEKKYNDRIGLGRQRAVEEDADRNVLLPRPPTPNSERLLYEAVISNLRAVVGQVLEDDTFERTLLYGWNAAAAAEHTPTTRDVDAILASMMPEKCSIFPEPVQRTESGSFLDTNSLSTAGRRTRAYNTPN